MLKRINAFFDKMLRYGIQEQRDEHGELVMSLMDHLTELRNRLIMCVLVLIVAIIAMFTVSSSLFDWLARPLLHELEMSRLGTELGVRMIATDPTEIFFTYIKIACYFGLYITMPLILWQLYGFIAPGLRKGERKIIWPFMIATPVLFITGAMLLYYVLLPIAFKFFLGFQTQEIQLEARISEYLNLVMKLILAFGICFQLPVLLILLAKANIVTAKMLLSTWRYTLLGVAIVAAFLTPPDPFSQIALGGSIILLYFGSIYLIYLMEKAAGWSSFDEPEPEDFNMEEGFEALRRELGFEDEDEDNSDEDDPGQVEKSP